MKQLYGLLFTALSLSASAQINITVNAKENNIPISPYLYGRNNSLSDNPGNPVSEEDWQLYKDAGVRIMRENGGNNSTKYNWKAKLSSHPDWYNNIYDHDWDYSAQSLLDNSDDIQGFYGFQLLGKVAANKNNNFNDWAYNGSAWWSGTTNNWAGGGGPSGNGNSELYLKSWPADSTTAILDHWFGNLKFDKNRFLYWNMDNEPEIWNYTHDDATGQITAEEFVQRYIKAAKLARQKFPEIKLVGPVSPNEWQWYAWNNAKVKDPSDNKNYVWMEYFIKRIAEEEKKSEMRLLDVLDVHFYPGTADKPAQTLQLHKVWFDTTYVYSGANGVKTTAASGWDNSINKEYFFERCNRWVKKYMGAERKMGLGISEYGAIADHANTDASVIACWYASHLGTFADRGVELFTPWDWYEGQWEVLHLFSNYYGKTAAKSVSSDEKTIGAYSSLSANKDTLVIALVNKDQANSQDAEIAISDFVTNATTVKGYQLADLSGETFESKQVNALQKKQYTLAGGKISATLPALSVTLIQIPANAQAASTEDVSADNFSIFPNPAKDEIFFECSSGATMEITFCDIAGREIVSQKISEKGKADVSGFVAGTYLVKVKQGEKTAIRRIVVQ